ncbi:hypothetical protein [Gimesia aquarii]|uniref:Tetratricopeptide repeat protein n=1 Tax=Gimesia aquarii TaxID=2527964 RepID=A0A517WRL2_9PLAN|nr:hypothetical protein [Gimesia aquarii]QDU07858.1 hypothetical protein V202x_12190 [Gimesia aquarii]
MQPPAFDVQAAHHFFATDCFNQAWSYIEKEDRTSEENLLMISASHASYWHWTQFEEHTPINLSIAYWQLSRVYAITNQPSLAISYGTLCLKVSQMNHLSPFYIAYAYEALARATSAANKQDEVSTYLEQAKKIAESELEEDEKQQLLADLNTI